MNDPFTTISHMLESAKDLTVEAAASAAAKLADTPNHAKPKEIIKLLNSSFEHEILNGLKVVISYMSTGKDASQFFPYVIKNINNSNLKIRKLIYIYLTRFSETNPDLVLLSINSIQKSLSDKNPQIRALGLRIISSINNPTILSISMLAIKNSVNDLSPMVRRSSAICISKMFKLMANNIDETQKTVLIEQYLNKLMNDSELLVVNSAIIAFNNVCPNNYSMIHPLFRHYCSVLSDFDEWTQIVLINILTNYCRIYLPRPKIINLAGPGEFIYLPDDEFQIINYPVYEAEFHPDLQLFLDSMKNLIYSPNDALILSIIKAFYFLTPAKTLKDYNINTILIRQLQNSPENLQIFKLQIILYVILKKDSIMFQNHFKTFYLLPTDTIQIAKLKLCILSLIINENNIKSIVNELKYYALYSPDDKIAIEATKTIGKCSQINIHWNKKVLQWLLKQVEMVTKDDDVDGKLLCTDRIINECLTVIRYLIQQSPENNVKPIIKLASIIINEKFNLNASAKSSIIWLVGEFTNIIPKFLPDFIRVLVKSFKNEEEIVRSNILLIVCKYYTYDIAQFQLKNPETTLQYYPRDATNVIYNIFNHVINLCKYDNSYDIRDQARMFHQLLSSDRIELANLILQAPKPIPLILISNQPILNNLASPKLNDDFYPGVPKTGGIIGNGQKIIDIAEKKKNQAEEASANVEVSPQPSNKNSFSEKKLNTGLTVPKSVATELYNNGDKGGDFENVLMPCLSSFMTVPQWSDVSKLLPDSIRDTTTTTSQRQQESSLMASGFGNVKAISSSSFLENKYQAETSNHAMSSDTLKRGPHQMQNFNLKNNYKLQSLDEFLSSQDGRMEMISRNKKYLKKADHPKKSSSKIEDNDEDEEYEEDSESEDESEEDESEESEEEEDDDEYSDSDSDSEDESAQMLK